LVGLNFNPSLIHRQFVVGGGGLNFSPTNFSRCMLCGKRLQADCIQDIQVCF
jgi:hypothetical protein